MNSQKVCQVKKSCSLLDFTKPQPSVEMIVAENLHYTGKLILCWPMVLSIKVSSIQQELEIEKKITDVSTIQHGAEERQKPSFLGHNSDKKGGWQD